MANCSNCGSANISFRRENVGEVRGKSAKQIVHRTVGYCKDCGYTWVSSMDEVKGPRRTWLWVIGWMVIFPIPLSILMLRKRNMNPIIKIAIIVAGWAVYLFIGLSGRTT